MTAKTPKRPRDPNQLAKMIVDIATTGQEPASPSVSESTTRARVKAAEARSAKLTPSQRAEIAQNAAKARWHKP